MTALDVIEDVGSGLGPSAVMPAVYMFPFQQAEEAFCGGQRGNGSGSITVLRFDSIQSRNGVFDG
jgi:hypothetical protein